MGVNEREIDIACVRFRLFDRVFGDLVKHHSAHGHLRLQHLEQVPGDRLTLAVLISCEPQLVRIFQGPLELGDRLLLVRVDHIIRSEVLVDIDGELAERPLLELCGQLRGFGEVTNMPDRCNDLVVVTKVAANGFCLGR